MDIRNIKRIIDTMKANDLTEFSMKDKDLELTLKRIASEQQVVYASAPAAPAPAAPALAAAPAAAAPDTEADENDGLVEIPSPIVGTFYRRPAPDADNFVQVGSEIDEDTVVCIAEAMKVMNEIRADVSGVIKKMLVDDATPVQYGQPLFLVEAK